MSIKIYGPGNYTTEDIAEIKKLSVCLLVFIVVWIIIVLSKAIKYYNEADTYIQYYHNHEEDLWDHQIIDVLKKSNLSYKNAIWIMAKLVVPIIVMVGTLLLFILSSYT